MNRDIDRRIDALERTAGISDDREAQIAADAEWVRNKILEMSKRLTDAERAELQPFWDHSLNLVRTDPVMAKLYAGLTMDEWRL